MAVAARILFQIILMVLFGGIVIFEWADLYKELLAAAPLDVSNALHRFLRAFVGVIDAGLILTASVVSLLFFHRGIDDVEVRQQQRVKAYLLGVVFHPHGFSEAGIARADDLIVGVRLTGSVGVAALGVDNAGDGLHQLFHAPKAAACQIDDVFRRVHMHALLTGHILSACFLTGFLYFLLGFLRFLFLRHILPGGTAAQQQYCGKQEG